MEPITLKTKAIDNHGHHYDVVIKSSRYSKGPVLSIEDTPGQWAIDTLLDRGSYPDGLFIDIGQNWKCGNMNQILDELRKLIKAGGLK